MTKVLVLYYSSWGHVERMAEAVAEGVREAGAEVTIKRVPELVPEEVARQSLDVLLSEQTGHVIDIRREDGPAAIANG